MTEQFKSISEMASIFPGFAPKPNERQIDLPRNL